MRFRPSIFALLIALPATAQVPVTQVFTQSPAYKECTALANSNPIEAEHKALAWLQVDDSVGAQHCMAMALYGQRRFAEAADRLALVRSKLPPEQVAMRTYVARQAEKAWIDAGRPDAAIDLIGLQINDMAAQRGNNAANAAATADLLLDRARLRITYGQLAEAVQDLDHAVSLTPVNEDVLLERASAFEQLGDLGLAKNDVASVLKINPANAKAKALQQRLDQKAAATKAL